MHVAGDTVDQAVLDGVAGGERSCATPTWPSVITPSTSTVRSDDKKHDGIDGKSRDDKVVCKTMVGGRVAGGGRSSDAPTWQSSSMSHGVSVDQADWRRSRHRDRAALQVYARVEEQVQHLQDCWRWIPDGLKPQMRQFGDKNTSR